MSPTDLILRSLWRIDGLRRPLGHRPHFLKEFSKNLIDRRQWRILRQMLLDVLNDALRRPRVLHLGIAVRPVATGMQRVPRRTQIGAGSRIIAVLAEAIANVDLVVPDWFEQMNEVVLGRILPSGLHDNRPILEILQAERASRLRDVLAVIV